MIFRYPLSRRLGELHGRFERCKGKIIPLAIQGFELRIVKYRGVFGKRERKRRTRTSASK
jgi:hypothetical protein